VDAAAEHDVTLDRRRLKISDPVKSLGDYDISVRLHPEVLGTFRLKVVPEAEPGPEAGPPQDAPAGGEWAGEAPQDGPAPYGDDAPEGPAPEAEGEEAATDGPDDA
jgi:large subunit ribosomal protein L9